MKAIRGARGSDQDFIAEGKDLSWRQAFGKEETTHESLFALTRPRRDSGRTDPDQELAAPRLDGDQIGDAHPLAQQLPADRPKISQVDLGSKMAAKRQPDPGLVGQLSDPIPPDELLYGGRNCPEAQVALLQAGKPRLPLLKKRLAGGGSLNLIVGRGTGERTQISVGKRP